ncbi:hypothetical protein [Persicobacter sp. CCB-QB2]|uniref:hypothetical protein n=1 Tax=Persicobacter sp. CCB-QB2 TaxID=1561025 RepID=UPI0012FBE967|nr:hypothetical protein [Persicobacter sp. CCB-QB2]
MIKVYPKSGLRWTLSLLVLVSYSAFLYNFYHVANSPEVSLLWLISTAFAFALSIVSTVRFLMEMKSYTFIKKEFEETRLFGLQKTVFPSTEMKLWLESDIEVKGKPFKELIIAFPNKMIRLNPQKHTHYKELLLFLGKHFKGYKK